MMVSIENILIVVFLIILGLLIIAKRKHMVVHKALFPLFYALVWRTKLGIKAMDAWAKKMPRVLTILGYLSIIIGFVGMILIAGSLVHNLYKILLEPATSPGVGLVLPVKAKGVFFVPFFYWIISIFVLAVVHEFAHGVYARLFKMKVKSSGFAVLCALIPIIPAAFVEPDEKEIVKRPAKEQLMVYSAGPFANVITAIIVVLIVLFVFGPISSAMVEPAGVLISGTQEGLPAYEAGIPDGSVVTSIGSFGTLYAQNFSDALAARSPGDIVSVHTNNGTYNVTLTEHPEDANKAYMGVFVGQETQVKESFTERYGEYTPAVLIWLIGLFYWLYVLNLGIGLFNLVPVGPLDGGRMLLVALEKYFSQEKARKIWAFVSLVFFVLIIANIVVAFI